MTEHNYLQRLQQLITASEPVGGHISIAVSEYSYCMAYPYIIK